MTFCHDANDNMSILVGQPSAIIILRFAELDVPMSLKDRKILTFDVVGTLIDFEASLINFFRPIIERSSARASDASILSSFAAAEDKQDYQVDLLENYKTNIALYAEWQAAFRAHSPKTLIV